MKIVRCLATFLLALGPSMLLVRGDWNQDYEADCKSVQTDPDATPDAFVEAQKVVTPAETAARKERERKAWESREWLLHAYEEQTKARAKTDDADLSAKNDLEKEAGISTIDLSDISGVKAGDDTDKSKTELRPDPATDTTVPPKTASLFRPFLSGAGPSSQLPFSAPSPIFPVTGPLSFDSSSTADDSSGPPRSATQDPSSMDIPGLTAAESNPAVKQAADLDPADLAPGVTPSTDDKTHHALQLELPTARNSERLDKMQDAALNLPNQLPRREQAPTAVPASTTALPPKGDTDQMVPDPSPIRSRLADPYDILQ